MNQIPTSIVPLRSASFAAVSCGGIPDTHKHESRSPPLWWDDIYVSPSP